MPKPFGFGATATHSTPYSPAHLQGLARDAVLRRWPDAEVPQFVFPAPREDAPQRRGSSPAQRRQHRARSRIAELVAEADSMDGVAAAIAADPVLKETCHQYRGKCGNVVRKLKDFVVKP